MKILFLSSWFPYPPDNGARQRALNLLKQLAQKHAVSLLALTDDESPREYKELTALTGEVQTYPRRSFNPHRWKSLAGFASPLPRYLVETYEPELEALIQRTVVSNGYDAVIASGLTMARYAPALQHPVKVFEEVETGIFADSYHNAQGLSKLRARLMLRKYEIYLRALCKTFAAVTVVSEQEAQSLSTLGVPRAQISVIPNGVNCADAPTPTGSFKPFSMIYSGALTFGANLGAMRYFSREILPLIRSQEPRAQLTITGRADQVAINELSAHNAILFTGYVSDVRSLIQSSAVAVVPLRAGGGTRLKILEAMLLGTPVVSTRKGAEGLHVTDGKDILLADTPSEFAAATLRLFKDAPLRERIVLAARERVCAEYDWRDSGAKLLAVLQTAVRRA